MAKAYIIIRGWGEYSDRGTEPSKVYLNRAKAEAAMMALDAIYRKYRKLSKGNYEDLEVVSYPKVNEAWRAETERVNTICALAKLEYQEIGFDGDRWDDWELAEADLDNTSFPPASDG